MVVVRGWGEREMEHFLMGVEFQFGKMQTVLEIDCVTVLTYFS